MTYDFSKLKNSNDYLDRISQEIEKINAPAKTQKTVDERYWKLEVDKAGNGMAVIRFLPPPAVDGEDGKAWVRYWDHGFKGPTGRWYIEKSLTSIGKPDPVAEVNRTLWNASSDPNSAERKQARDQKRRLHYVSNIYVISDPKNPQNEGKVFLFKYGKKIFDKITRSMKPEFPGEVPVNPFDMFTGANFKIRRCNIGGYPNFDQSTFDSPAPLLRDDNKLEEIWKSEYSLKEINDPSTFKSYDELKARLDAALGNRLDYDPVPKKALAPTSGVSSIPDDSDDDEVSFAGDDDDDLEAFNKLVG